MSIFTKRSSRTMAADTSTTPRSHRLLSRARVLAAALLIPLALSAPALSAQAAPSASGKTVTCDKALLSQAHNEAVAAVGYLNYLHAQYNSSALAKALKEEKNVVSYTKDCQHLSKAFNNAYAASGDYYNFYYNSLPVGADMTYPNYAKTHVNNAYNLVEVVYGTSK